MIIFTFFAHENRDMQINGQITCDPDIFTAKYYNDVISTNINPILLLMNLSLLMTHKTFTMYPSIHPKHYCNPPHNLSMWFGIEEQNAWMETLDDLHDITTQSDDWSHK